MSTIVDWNRLPQAAVLREPVEFVSADITSSYL
jgi:hypothetical protein